MRRLLSALLFAAPLVMGATFGTVVTVTGDPGDLVLDERRSRLYILNTTAERVDVYSTSDRRIFSSFSTGVTPLAAAISPDGKHLYVTSYSGSALEIYDLDTLTLFKRVGLPSSPEGVAVGGDGRVLITTIGGGSSTSTDNRLMLYDPASGDGLRAIPTTLPPPAAAQVTSPPNEIFQASRSRLMASADGRFIVGLDNPTTTTRLVFVYETASASVLRSRQLSSISSVLSVSPDGSKFMAGLSLFETSTLAILAQQNTANSLYPFASNANFNTQQNQGGSVFAPDGATLYSAFNIAPVQNPAAKANSSQLMLSDPDNLLIKLGLQLPENLVGKMVISSNGSTVYALSQSGVLALPVSAIYDSPIAVPESNVVLLANDQCGATSAMKTARIKVANAGRGRMSVTAQVNSGGATITFPLGGNQGTAPGGGAAPGGGGQPAPGPGGGAPGAPIIVPFPTPGGGTITNPGTVTIPPGTTPAAGRDQLANTATQQTAVTSTAPLVSVEQGGTEATAVFTYNASASTSIGTILPTDFLIQSQEAINIPARVRVYQNNRNTESVANILTAPVSISTAEGLVDMAIDNTRQRVYIANSGLNRVEVLDMRTNQFLDPIKVGQLPRSLALAPDGNTLYVANTGGESISVIDLDQRAVTGRVRFPPVPYNASFALNTPSLVAASLSGLQIMMSNGKLWKVVNNEALPRPASAVLGTATLTSPYNMVATPGGEYVLLLAGSGTAYLYDALEDEFVLKQAVVTTPIQGYFGPLAAGPRGQYYVVNGNLLNASLTLQSTAAPGGTTRPISAVTAVGANQFARFVQPVRASANAAVTGSPTVELVDVASGQARGGASAPEGPLSTQTGTARVNMTGRQMAVNAAGTAAYLLTVSGVSVVSLSPAALTSPPAVASGGVVNSASYGTAIAQGSVVSIFGANLATTDQASRTPLPTVLGGVCATLNNKPLSLLSTAPNQINAQIPVDLAAGRYPLVIRSLEKNVASASQTVTVAKLAPAAYTLSNGYAALYHKDGRPVTSANPAKRDEVLTLYATGLGSTTGGKVTTGQPAPSSPLAVTDKVQVYFGDPNMKQSEVIVDWSGLAPGFIGLYQLNLRVPGDHTKGDPLPVTIKIGGVSSPAAAPVAAKVAVD